MSLLLCHLLVSTLCCVTANSYLFKDSKDNVSNALIYLYKFGYMKFDQMNIVKAPKDILAAPIADFQAFAGLNVTGVLDEETITLMKTPRCGVRDIIGHGARSRRKRYVLQGSKWKVKAIRYSISKYPTTRRLSRHLVEQQVRKAFSLWENVTDLSFQQTNHVDSHMDIRFDEYEHGDGMNFDGIGGTLAHAYFPEFGGDIHMDNSEVWTINSTLGTNMLQILVHEIGHSLGLSHSDTFGSLMAPFYRDFDPDLALHEDDIRAIEELYEIKKKKVIDKTTQSVNVEIDETMCNSSNVDAIIMTASNETFAFQGALFWKLNSDGIAPGYPKLITSHWDNLENDIDAAFTSEDNGMTYIFKEDKYWIFRNTKYVRGPKRISVGFPGIPNDIDAAFIWSGNGDIYFFKGDLYWKFDMDKSPHIHRRYPQYIEAWSLPGSLDAAFQWENGKTYFFKNDEYYRFDDRNFAPQKDTIPYPRSIGVWWFGCKEAILQPQQNILKPEDEVKDYIENEVGVGDEVLDVGDFSNNLVKNVLK